MSSSFIFDSDVEAGPSYHRLTTPLLSSELDLDITPSSSFNQTPTRPSEPSDRQLLPLSLRPVSHSKNRKDNVVIYPQPIKFNSTREYKQVVEQFLTWWYTTSFGAAFNPNNEILIKDKKIWDGSKRSTVWSAYSEVARFRDGVPCVQCRHCSQLLSHPGTKNSGTSTMQQHLSRCGVSHEQSEIRTIDMMLKAQKVSRSFMLLKYIIEISNYSY